MLVHSERERHHLAGDREHKTWGGGGEGGECSWGLGGQRGELDWERPAQEWPACLSSQ